MLTCQQIPDPTQEEATQAMDVARRKAAVLLSELIDDLGIRAADAATSTPNKLSIAEHLYKVSGMAAKQAANESKGTGFSLRIEYPSINGAPSHTITITKDQDVLPDRDHSRTPLFTVSDDLTCEYEVCDE